MKKRAEEELTLLAQRFSPRAQIGNPAAEKKKERREDQWRV